MLSTRPIPFLPTLFIVFLTNVSIAWIAARIVRRLTADDPITISRSPLYDAQLDHPA